MHSTSIRGLSGLPQTLVTRILPPNKQTAHVGNQNSFAAAPTACAHQRIPKKNRGTAEKQQENIFI